MANFRPSGVSGAILRIFAFGVLCALLGLLSGGSLGKAAAAGQVSGPTGIVDDSPGYRVLSDGRGIYLDGAACVSVIAGAAGGGFYQIRTVRNSDDCNGQTWGERRFLKLDFGSEIEWDLDLDPNDSTLTVEGVPARFIAGKAYAKRAVTTPVSIFILKINEPSGTTTQDTAWELRYKNEAGVVVYPDGSRVISLDPGFATADLYEIVQVIKKGRVTTQAEYKATYDMPFRVTATVN